MAREAGVADRVHFRPSLPLERLLAGTAEADVGRLLLEDTCENHRLALPNKLFEYFAAGVPVVASDLPEMGRVVREHAAGETATPGDPGDVARAIHAVLADPGFRDRARDAGRALAWDHERARLLSLFEDLGGGAASPDAVLLVRNGVSHDARVLRAAATLTRSGRRALVVGVAATPGQQERERIGGVDVLRLRPRIPLRRARSAASRAPAEAGTVAPAGAPRLGVIRRLARLAVTVDFNRRAVAALVRLKPALIHANDHNTMWAALAAKALTGSRVVYDAHELWPDRNGRWEWRPWLLVTEAWFVRAADRVVTASPGYADRMAARYRIPPPAVVRNVPAADGRVAPPALPSPEPVAVYAGGLMPGRGLEQAIDALPLAHGVRLRLVGPGPPGYAASLRERAARLGVSDRLELRPPVPPGELPAELADAAFGLSLIQPICESYVLTLPNKLFEYLAAGLPVLTSDVPVSADFVRRHGVGEVVPAADTAAIARAMTRMLDPVRRDALRPAIEAARSTVTWERESAVLLEAYGASRKSSPLRSR